MCDSPYVVCLPEANTPNVGFWTNQGMEPYQTDTATYTVEMCKRECAYDQRCTGFEFWAEGEDGSGLTGKCSLIDDIPIEIGTSADAGITTEGDLDGKTAADFTDTALCWEKDVDCNPYFGEDDLSEIMLNCYCPNNRKGFYTKNVKRTVSATRFCGADSDGAITRRIREAQANRMFHLCENWCLFNTQDPRTESWYHDPWEECWREQYAGVGTHRSYCYRVIRDPFTIEQYFIDNRAANMCAASDASKGFGNNVNTPAPVIAPGSFITESTNNTIATLQQKMRHDMQVVNMITRNSARSRKYVDDRQAGGGNLAGFDHKKIFWVPTKFNGVPHDLAAYGHLSGGGIHGTPAQVAQIQQTQGQ